MPTDQPDGIITGFEGFQGIQRACCKRYASQPGGPQGAGGFGYDSACFFVETLKKIYSTFLYKHSYKN